MKRIASIAAGIALLVVVGVAYAGLVGHGHGVQATPLPVAKRSSRVSVTGHVGGLYPGGTARLHAQVEDGTRHAIKVVSVSALVERTSGGCPVKTLSVKPYRGRLRIKAHRAKRVSLPVAMSKTAPDACQGARYQLLFIAQAKRP